MSKAIDPLAAKIEIIKAMTLGTRETLAAQLFKAEIISEQMAKAAVSGLSFVKVDTKGIDLQATKAAAALVKRLTAAGAECEWLPRALGESGFLRYADLIISWK